MLEQTRSVISTVGPYQFYGNDLLTACVTMGKDYFDLCGEPIWMRPARLGIDSKGEWLLIGRILR